MFGQPNVAVVHGIGSNNCNLLAVLGLSATVAPEGLPVSEAALWFDRSGMVAVAVACLPIFFAESVIAQWERALFLGY